MGEGGCFFREGEIFLRGLLSLREENQMREEGSRAYFWSGGNLREGRAFTGGVFPERMRGFLEERRY